MALNHYERISISKLKFDQRNARKHDAKNIKAIKDSLIKFGQQKPIVVMEDGTVIAGNGTLQAAKELGWDDIDVRWSGLKKDEAIAYGLVDNRSAELAEWDNDTLGTLLSELDAEGWDLDALGWSDDELSKLIHTGTDGKTDEDAVPETEHNEFGVERGQIWILGNHRLMCGDSTLSSDVNALMNGEKASLVLTDPPYNVAVNDESEESLKARNRRSDGLKIKNDKMSEDGFLDFLRSVFSNGLKIKNDKMSEDGFLDFLRSVFSNYYESVLDGGSIYVFYADSMTIPFMSTFIDAGFHFAQNCIWNKQQFVMTRKDYHYKHEPVLYGWRKGKAHSWHGDRKQSSVWNFDRPFKNDVHPTMKPIDLLEYPICNSSSVGSLVLDLFLGSGSTLIACEKTGRKCYGMELDPHYCSVIIKRWQDFTGKQAVKL